MTRNRIVPDDGSGDGAFRRAVRGYPVLSIYTAVVVTVTLILRVVETI